MANTTAHSPEQFAASNGVQLCYDTFGDRNDAPLLLIMGLGAQMILWDDGFCSALAERGFFVIRFDNRDIGRSTKIAGESPPLPKLIENALTGKPINAPYTLRDMAADAIGLLDALGIERAHVVGASMGAAITQELAIHFPQRLLSATCIMGTSGDPRLPPPTQEAMEVLMSPSPTDKEAFRERFLWTWRVLRGSAFPETEDRERARALRIFERGLNPPGVARQLAAIFASGDRTKALPKVRVPTLVIHGTADPLVPVEGGRAIAAGVPGAKLVEIEGMGHAIPEAVWPRVIGAISDHAKAKSA
ncbi:MAG: alpha/beta fold hydrolase [Methylobacteriaceae bacterium]|nr:alpha/beta fold hydrolase [Methylobacteriaceae bacterium]